MATWIELQRAGTRLAVLDLGGSGPAALLIHGIAGHAGEWTATASWLRDTHRVLAIDCRGHGRSERRPSDVSPQAHLDDAVFVLRELAEGPATLIGHSFGGRTALLVAAHHPELVRALVFAESSPAGAADMAERTASTMVSRLLSWPVPFSSQEEAVAFFGGPKEEAKARAGGLEAGVGGWWSAFDVDVMVEMLREDLVESHWDEWDRIRCPTLVVRAGRGLLSEARARSMVERRRGTKFVEIADSPHNVHLYESMAWRVAVTGFLAEVLRTETRSGAG